METGMNDVTEREKIAWLSRYVDNYLEMQRLERELYKWREISRRTGSSIFKATRTASEDRLQQAVDEIGLIEDELTEQLIRRTRLRRLTDEAIDSLKDYRLQNVLRFRYVDGMTWERAAEEMHYSPMQVCRLHKKAIAEVQLPADLHGCTQVDAVCKQEPTVTA